MNKKLQKILLIEDDANDVLLIEKALHQVNFNTDLEIVADGDEAIAYLTRQKNQASGSSRSLPWLILLDLKLPRCSGFEFLTWLRQQPDLKSLVVIALTSSQQRADIDKAYKLGVNSYLVKPVKFEDLVNLMAIVEQYWVETNEKPILFNN